MSARLSLVSILVSAAFAMPAGAGDWFLHEYEELRSYHKDWLDVCDDNGKGQCRAVQYEPTPEGSPFFGDARLGLYSETGGRYVAEIYDSQLQADAVDQIVFVFDDNPTVVKLGAWELGGIGSPNLAETVAFTDQAFTTEFVQNIRDKNHLRVLFENEGQLIGVSEFSLRGSAAALLAIEAHEASR